MLSWRSFFPRKKTATDEKPTTVATSVNYRNKKIVSTIGRVRSEACRIKTSRIRLCAKVWSFADDDSVVAVTHDSISRRVVKSIYHCKFSTLSFVFAKLFGAQYYFFKKNTKLTLGRNQFSLLISNIANVSSKYQDTPENILPVT